MNKPLLPPASHERELYLVFLFLCFVLVYFSWFPGVFTMDESDISRQAMGGPLHDGHSPLLVWFWSLTSRIFVGPALPYFIGLAAALYFSQRLLRQLSLTRAGSAIALFVLVLLPPVFVTLGLVTKDLFFVATMLATFVALINYLHQARRKTLLVAALAMQLAVMIRVDAVFALFPLAVYATWRELSARRSDSAAIRMVSMVIAAMLILCLLGVSRFANRYVFKASPFHAEQVTMLFDLSAMSVDTDTMLLPASRLDGGYPLSIIRARLNPAIADKLIWSGDEYHLIYRPDANHGELASAWIGAIRRHPVSYLKFRAEYMAQFIGLRNNTPRLRGQFFADESIVGDGSQGWRKTHSPLQQLYYGLSESEIGKYLYMPWLWLGAGVVVLFGFGGGWLRAQGTRVERIIPQLLVISALSYTFLMATISTAAMGRYHSWPRVAIGIALLVALSELAPGLRARLRRARARSAAVTIGTSQRIAYLDGLRGLAILAVILFHAYARWPSLMPYHGAYAAFPLFQYGWLGVELFFMISGFVILMTLDKCTKFGDFMFRRWLRLFPAMLICSLLIFMTAPAFPERPAGTPILSSLLPGLTFIGEDVWGALLMHPVPQLEGAFWSLFVEVKFYVIFGAAYFILGRSGALVTIFSAFLVAMYLPADWVSGSVTGDATARLMDAIGARYFGWFVSGALFYIFVHERRFGALVLALLVGVLAAFNMIPTGSDSHWLSAPLGVLVIFTLAILAKPLQRVLELQLFLFVGFVSYPLYLLHENAMIAMTIQLGQHAAFMPKWLLPALPIALLLLLSWSVARFFEPALHQSIKRLPYRASGGVSPGVRLVHTATAASLER